MGFGKRYKWYFLGLFDRIEDSKERVIRGMYGGGRLLNVGCGASRIGDVGVDLSGEVLEQSPIAEKCVADARHLPFPDKSFACAYCSELLHHADEPEKVVAEMCRVAENVIIVEADIRNPIIWAFTRLLPFDRDAHFFTEDSFRNLLKPYDHRMWRKGFMFMSGIWMWAAIRTNPRERSGNPNHP
jgi:SAM-dependent methyltransferase